MVCLHLQLMSVQRRWATELGLCKRVPVFCLIPICVSRFAIQNLDQSVRAKRTIQAIIRETGASTSRE